jgi:hypothetical protein
MVKFTTEQALAVVEIQQLVNEWAYIELDLNNGQNMGELVTEDCVYETMTHTLRGRAAIESSYRDRLARLSAASASLPFMRHLNANLSVRFRSADEAAVAFCLTFFTTEATGSTLPDPTAVADVRMECRREADGHWRIAKNESSRPFIRA